MPAAEKAAASTGKCKSMVEVLDEVRANKKLSEAAQWDDRDEFRDGLLARTPDEMMRSVKAWKVMPGAVNEKTAEMTNVSCVSGAVSS